MFAGKLHGVGRCITFEGYYIREGLFIMGELDGYGRRIGYDFYYAG